MISPRSPTLCSKVSAASVFAVAAHCPELSAFYLERAGRVSSTAVSALAEGCPLLQVLDLGWCDLRHISARSPHHLRHISTRSPPDLRPISARPPPHLRPISAGSPPRISPGSPTPISHPDLPPISPPRCEVGDEALAALARYCPNLSTVSLAYCEAVSDGGLEALCCGCVR